MENSDRVNTVTSTRRLDGAFYAVVGITALAAFLRFWDLGKQSLWLDETLSVEFASKDWASLWKVVSTNEANMSLYYFMLHGWLYLGKSEFAVRSLYAIAGILTIPAIYVLGKWLFSTRTALLATFLLATNTFHIQYSQEARSYSLVVLLTTLSSLFFVRAMELRSWREWVWYTLITASAPYCHFFAVMVIIAQWSAVAVLARREVVPWRQFLASVAFIVLLCLPLAVYLRHGSNGHLDWVPRTQWSDLPQLFSSLAGESRLLGLSYVASCVAALFFAVRAARTSDSAFIPPSLDPLRRSSITGISRLTAPYSSSFGRIATRCNQI